MIRPAATALLLAASATLALAATDAELKEQIGGAWGQDAQCAEGSLTFNTDGTFVLARPGEGSESGTWDIAGGILGGTTAEGREQPAATVRIEGDTLYLGSTESSRVETLTRCPA